MPTPPVQAVVVNEVSLQFGGVAALTDVSLDLRRDELLAVIGPNGAGKTSLLNCLNGLYRPTAGSIVFDPEGRHAELHRLAPHRIAELGIARSFQNIELFRHMSVLDNVMLGRHTRMRGGLLRSICFWGPQQREEIAHRRRVEEIIDFLELQPYRHRAVGQLAYGVQKLVELARALAVEPSVLLLDEPMAGMNAEERESLARYVIDINEEWGVTVLVIDHDMDVIMDIAHRVAVLDFGRLIAIGSPEEIRRDPRVIAAYLGEASDATGNPASTLETAGG